MKSYIAPLFIFILSTLGYESSAQNLTEFKPKEVYKSTDLIILQIAENSFQHISFLQTNDFGNVPCNGLVVRNNNDAIIFDTPTNDKSAKELIIWVEKNLHCKINAIVPTHFHEDCLGGLNVFHRNNISSYGFYKTIEFAKENHAVVPKYSFSDSLVLKIGVENVIVKYFGEGHTKDNVVAYFPNEKILFGGCLVKELGATKGYLGDANVGEWSNTIERIKKEYPMVKIILPGHGEPGNINLLDYTINLFKNQ